MDKKLLKQYKSTFHFGASVSYNKILKRGYKDHHGELGWNHKVEKAWKEKDTLNRIGVVIGWRWLSNGIDYYSQDEGRYYTATQSVFAIEIKRGMMNKVDLVLPESLKLNHVTLYTAYDGKKIIPDRVDVFPEKNKAWLRDVMKDVKRDARGRWI